MTKSDHTNEEFAFLSNNDGCKYISPLPLTIGNFSGRWRRLGFGFCSKDEVANRLVPQMYPEGTFHLYTEFDFRFTFKDHVLPNFKSVLEVMGKSKSSNVIC